MLYFLVVDKLLYVDIDHAEGSLNNNSTLVVHIRNTVECWLYLFFLYSSHFNEHTL